MAQALEALFYEGMDQKRRDYTPSGAAIVNGQVVDMGDGLIGVCTSPEGIADGAMGSLATADPFKFRKAVSGGVTFARGEMVAWDDVANTAVAAPGDFNVGVCIEDAADGDDHVKADLNRAAIN